MISSFHCQNRYYLLKSVVEKGDIKKLAKLQQIHHSYPNHLLERGTILSQIQEVLGQNSPKTTEKYTPIIQKSPQSIKNPIDEIQKRKYIKGKYTFTSWVGSDPEKIARNKSWAYLIKENSP